MTANRAASSTVLLALLVLAIGINYIDRGSLSVVKTNVAAEFQLDNAQMGLLFSAFFWSYALSQIAAGWCVDRFDVKWLYAGGFLIWSVATVLMALSNGFALFLLLRLVLGVGESVAFPASSRVIVMNFKEDRRGIANALIDAASKLGPTISLLLGGLLVANHGWRMLFLVVGLGGMLWLPVWLYFVPSQHRAASGSHAHAGIGFGTLMSRREVWGTSLGFFCLGYTWAFLLSWLPAYLEESRGFTKESMAIFGSMPFAAMAATSIFGGWLSDRLIRGGGTPTRVRKSFLIGGLLLCAVFMYSAMAVEDHGACILLLCLACASLGFYTSNVWAVTQTLAGPNAAGQWTGLQNAIGNVGSAISPALTGWLVKETGTYSSAFAAASAILVAGVFAYVLLIRQVSPLDWRVAPQQA
ncbi:MFS transporter [Planctomicrobium piriforme]|uniref:Sugar phosphate permease n=1 Tax=Planctomicrobium piriforme TaxID=1576369 RepID=A0A1I3IN94_9PLAN|nr:MFS transporter [Planctomicrobium piriforme]SFI49465.1 Sugar phosphate permease [Planctomicrobium piriforme]